MDLRDLTPQKDPKGGSPRTPPGGIRVSEYAEFPAAPTAAVHESGVWKVIACSSISALLAMTVAWFTAMQAKGISESELKAYVKEYSPYVFDKDNLARQQAAQDTEMGRIAGRQERVLERLGKIDELHVGYDRSIQDLYKKVDTITNYMEAEKTPKR